MNILVVGGGHLGRAVAEELDRMGHDIAVIEVNEDKLAMLSSQFTGVTFNSFPMDINNLKDAGIENCDAVAVTTSDDNLNITVGQIAKSVFGIDLVISRISDQKRESIFENFGLKTVCPTNMATDTIISAITSPYKAKTISFGTNVVNFKLLESDKRNEGRRLNDIMCPPDEAVFGLLKPDGKFMLATAYDCPRIELGDTIILAKKID